MSDDPADWCFGFAFEAALELSSRSNPAPVMSALLEEGLRIADQRSEAEFKRRKAMEGELNEGEGA